MKVFDNEKFKMNIQLFAGEGDDPANPDGGDDKKDPPADDKKDDNKDTKSYSEEEVQQMIKDRIKREKKNIPSKEDLAKFNQWKESQKTPEDKKKEEDEELERIRKEAQDYKSKVQMYENKEKVIKKNVPVHFSEFVTYEVNKLVNEDFPFDKALDKYLKENPQYINDGDGKNFKTSFKHTSRGEKTDGVTEAFYKRNPHLRPKN